MAVNIRRIDQLAASIAGGFAANPRVFSAWQHLQQEHKWTDAELHEALAKKVYEIAAAMEAESNNH